jgi:hypothetical protein
MRVRRLLPIALGLTLIGTAAIVVGSPPIGKPTHNAIDCPVPDANKCKSAGYIDSICGRRHLDVCKQPVIDAMQAHYQATPAPTVPMLGPGKHQLPSDLRQGKYFAYKPGSKFTQARNANSKLYVKATDSLRPHLAATHTRQVSVDRVTRINAATAAAFHREPQWAANGKRVESCAEYAYERNHDVVRFIDAASACRGDRKCVWDLAYMASSPGVAKRTLVDTDGRALPQIPLATGKFPKNDLFVVGDRFIRSNGTQPMTVTQAMLDLEAALKQGEYWYDIGSCSGNSCNARKFASEWTWHEHLQSQNGNLSEAEIEEYAARRAKFRALLEDWSAAVSKEAANLIQHEVHDVVLPFDMQTQNPLHLYGIERQFLDRSVSQRQQVQQKFGAGILDMTKSDALNQAKVGGKAKQGSWTGGGSTAGVLAAPTATPTSTSTSSSDLTIKPKKPPVEKASTSSANKTINPCLRPNGWGLEMSFRGPLSCEIGQFLRVEWDRKVAGHRSCLDLGNAGCDWSLDNFEAAILDAIPLLDQQLADERYCQAWTDGVTLPANTVAQAHSRLTANEAAFQESWPKVKEFDKGRTSSGRKFGKDWEGGDYLGDKDLFAAGYDYDVGWDVASLAKDSNGTVCKLGGSLHAGMGFDAWIVGKKVEVVDGMVRAEANHDDSGTVRYKAHLEMFGQSVFSTASSPNGWRVAQSFRPDPGAGFGITVPMPKPRFDIYVGVPVSGELWGELLFGSMLSAQGKAPTGCNPSNPEFSIGATYTPFFAAFGTGQVGVGISGIVSAGIRATLTLINVGFPVDVNFRVKTANNQQSLSFDSQVSVTVQTLSGRVSLYVEFLMFDEEFELFRWNGIGPAKAALMPKLTVDVPLAGMK